MIIADESLEIKDVRDKYYFTLEKQKIEEIW